MRLLILFILLLCSCVVNGQIVRTHPYYKPFAASCSYLLDQYSGAAAAYSLRKLDCDYAGSAIRVRRSSDNTESDIGFTSAGDLDTSALKTFVGTGGTDDGYIITFYDQSGNSNNATTSTASIQPLIVDNGVVQRKNGKPAIIVAGTQHLPLTTSLNPDNAYSNFVVGGRNSSGQSYTAIGSNSGTALAYTFNLGSTNTIFVANTTKYRQTSSGGSTQSGQSLIDVHYTATDTWSLYYNNSSQSFGSATSYGTGGQFQRLLNTNLSGTTGFFQEIVFYASDKSADRTGINSNINTYYSIY